MLVKTAEKQQKGLRFNLVNQFCHAATCSLLAEHAAVEDTLIDFWWQSELTDVCEHMEMKPSQLLTRL